MRQWYRSGLEGYCKSAAQAMGLPADNSGWGNFGRDLFPDGRFDDSAKASKTWVLSRYRARGRSNRMNLFEQSWLGKHGRDCEFEAVHACVHSLCAKGGDSTLRELYQHSHDSFARKFHSIMLPAIEEGFEAERYHPSDIACFAQGIDRVLSELDASLPQTFRNFAVPLVAGVIYGPDHAAARAGAETATLRAFGDADAYDTPLVAIDAGSIVLTQLFSDDAGVVGYSGAFDEDQAVLLGRGFDIASYAGECDERLAADLEGRSPVQFPISHTHLSTSKAHGVIACIGGSWYYHDLSSNGSYVENASQASTVHHGAVALAPGDRIYLGLSEPPEGDPNAFHLATAILVSFKLDETGLGSR